MQRIRCVCDSKKAIGVRVECINKILWLFDESSRMN